MPSPVTALLAAAALSVSLTAGASASADAAAPSAAAEPAAAALGVPKTFPLPPGAKARIVKDGKEYAGTITVRSTAAAFAFWKRELPRRGYTVRSAERLGSISEIRFRGHGCVGNSQLAATGSTRWIYQCDHA